MIIASAVLSSGVVFRKEDLAIKTLVYQSFRTHGVPVWMDTCMASVRQWAEIQGFSYRFIDDIFFSYAPEWFRERVKDQRHLVSDLARLELARIYLDEGWDRVIWVDADIYICDPHGFQISTERDYWLSEELWVFLRDNQLNFSRRANNAVMSFTQGNQFLDFYRNACQRIVRSKHEKLRHTEVGTSFLAGISHLLPLLKDVAIFSPRLLSAFYNDDQAIISRYQQELGVPIRAVNLCLTFNNTRFGDLLLDDWVFSQVIKKLDSLASNS
jgi:hypothetical protein